MQGYQTESKSKFDFYSREIEKFKTSLNSMNTSLDRQTAKLVELESNKSKDKPNEERKAVIPNSTPDYWKAISRNTTCIDLITAEIRDGHARRIQTIMHFMRTELKKSLKEPPKVGPEYESTPAKLIEPFKLSTGGTPCTLDDFRDIHRRAHQIAGKK